MSINSISGISGGSSTSPVQGGFRAAMKQAMSAVADKLGMSVTDLQAELKTGKSLTDVASAKGVSATDLLATIKQSLTSSGTSGEVSSLTGNALDALANRIANHKGGHHHHGGGAQGAQSVQGLFGTLAGQPTTSTIGASGTTGADKDGDNDAR